MYFQLYILIISDRDSKKFIEFKSLATNGSYIIKDDNVKKSTSKYLGMSNDFNLDVRIQSGKLRDRCLLAIILNFLNFVFESFRKRIRLEAFQFSNHRKII